MSGARLRIGSNTCAYGLGDLVQRPVLPVRPHGRVQYIDPVVVRSKVSRNTKFNRTIEGRGSDIDAVMMTVVMMQDNPDAYIGRAIIAEAWDGIRTCKILTKRDGGYYLITPPEGYYVKKEKN